MCSEEAAVLLRESEWVYLMGTSPVWHPQCPGSLPVLPNPLGPICVALQFPGTFSGGTWWPVVPAAPRATHMLMGSEAPGCRGRPVFWAWRKSVEAAGPGWPALVPQPEVLGPRKFWLLAVLPPHPLVTAQDSHGVLPGTPVFRVKINVSSTRAALQLKGEELGVRRTAGRGETPSPRPESPRAPSPRGLAAAACVPSRWVRTSAGAP